MRVDYEAEKLRRNTGVEWRPVNDDDFGNLYLISADWKVYSVNRHTILTNRRYKNCDKEYIELRADNKRRFYQLDELMLRTYPELFQSDAQIWAIIKIGGENTSYEVSQEGTVRRINNHHLLKAVTNRDGYCVFRLRHCGKTITEYAHRLVAAAFIPNPNGYEIVNHKDENRQNNAVSNLEWCDRSYNMLYNGASKRAALHAAETRKRKG